MHSDGSDTLRLTLRAREAAGARRRVRSRRAPRRAAHVANTLLAEEHERGHLSKTPRRPTARGVARPTPIQLYAREQLASCCRGRERAALRVPRPRRETSRPALTYVIKGWRLRVVVEWGWMAGAWRLLRAAAGRSAGAAYLSDEGRLLVRCDQRRCAPPVIP